MPKKPKILGEEKRRFFFDVSLSLEKRKNHTSLYTNRTHINRDTTVIA